MGLEVIERSEAIARAAVKAGCKFFAGYPITPASTILSYMMDLLPGEGGVAISRNVQLFSGNRSG